MKETEKQLRDIIKKSVAGHGEKNYSIVAGAGAGKTTLLSERISKEIAEGVPIEKFAVITYTNAAATELREKIVDKLRELKKDAGDQAAARIEDAIIRMETMQISTIHSFLLRILKESAFEAGITLDARMLEEDEAEARKQVFFEEWYKVHYPEMDQIRRDWTIRSRLSRDDTKIKRQQAGRTRRLGNQRDHSREVLENMFMDLAELREEIVVDHAMFEGKAREIAKEYIEIWREPLEMWRDAVWEGRKKGGEKPLKINNVTHDALDRINDLALYDAYVNDISRAVEIITKEIQPQSETILAIVKGNPNLVSIKTIEEYKEELSEDYIKIWEKPLEEWSEAVDTNNPLKKDGEKKSISQNAQKVKNLVNGNANSSIERAENLSKALSHVEEIADAEDKSGTQYYKVYDRHTEAVPPVDAQTARIKELKSKGIWDYKCLCQERRNRDAKDLFEIWLEPLSKWVDEVLASSPKDKNNKPKLDSKTREAIDCIRLAQSRDVELAKSLAAALYIISDKPEKNIYNANSKGALEGEKYVDPALRNIIDKMGIHTEWNFYKRYEDYISPVEKVIRVVEAVIPAQKEYQALIDARADELSNDDILYRSSKLLQEHPEVLAKVRNKFERIYVDEFQDTTKLQAGIVKLLAEKESGSLSDNKLIIVGDPKQSIYRFTGAEKAVYDAFNEAMDRAENAERLVLEENYRSNKAIVDWVNASFEKLMRDDYTPMETDWEIEDENTLYGVFSYSNEPETEIAADFGDSGSEEEENVETDQDNAAAEAQAAGDGDNSKGSEAGSKKDDEKYDKEKDAVAVAKLIRQLIDGGYLIEDHDTRRSRPIRFSDFMVITKYTSVISVFVRVFAEHTIPVDVNGKFDISDNEVVQNFKALLDYFANHKDKRNEYAAVQAYTGIDISKCDEDVRKEAAASLKEIRWEIEKKGLSPAGVLQYLVAHEELYVPKGRLLDQNAVRDYRMHITQMAEACLRDEYGDLAEVLKNVERYLDINVTRGIQLESDVNAVRLMNVHKAKGLTANIVIIANRKDSEEPRYSAFKKDGKYYPAASYKDIDIGKANLFPSFAVDEDLWDLAREEEKAENIRLQYVAATRAANALIIMPCVDKKFGKSSNEDDYSKPWKELEKPWFEAKEYYHHRGDIRDWMKAHDNEDAMIETAENADGKPKKNRRDLADNLASTDVEALKDARTVNVNPSGLELKGSVGYASSNTSYERENRPEGDIFGTILHRTFELYFNRRIALENVPGADVGSEMDSIINRAILENEENLRAGDDAADIKRYLSDVLKKYSTKVLDPIMDAANEIYPELGFSFYITGEEKKDFEKIFDECIHNDKIEFVQGEAYWVNGTSDLVVRQKNGKIKVFDYKSDARNGKPKDKFDEAVAEKYKYQLLLYRYAMGKVFGVNMDDVETEIIDLYR